MKATPESPRPDVPEGTVPLRKVKVSETLFRQMGVSVVDWGEPDADGFYTPTLRAEAADAAVPQGLDVERLALALANIWPQSPGLEGQINRTHRAQAIQIAAEYNRLAAARKAEALDVREMRRFIQGIADIGDAEMFGSATVRVLHQVRERARVLLARSAASGEEE